MANDSDIQQCIHQSRPLCWETAGNGVQHKKPSSLLSVQPLLPHASKHGLCEASSLYSSSNQHRIPSPLETHPSKSKQLSSRFPLSTPPSDITAHTMPNTPRHSRLAGRQPPAFIEIRPIQLSQWSTDRYDTWVHKLLFYHQPLFLMCLTFPTHVNGKFWM